MIRTFKYRIPHIPPSTNQFIGKNRRWEYQTEKKAWQNAVMMFCNPKPERPLEKAVVTIVYHFKDARRRDPDNYSGKFILDGLTRCGILADDSFDVITLRLAKGDISKEPYVEVILTEGRIAI